MTLFLDGNPFLCICKMEWLYKIIFSDDGIRFKNVFCSDGNSSLIQNLHDSDFYTCHPTLAPPTTPSTASSTTNATTPTKAATPITNAITPTTKTTNPTTPTNQVTSSRNGSTNGLSF